MRGRLDGSGRQAVRVLFGRGSLVGLSDAALLDRSRAGRDEAAFTALVERHGPMVLRVCRDVLRDPHDAQDAFQATFLVLLERGGSIRNRESLACWLHGVARRVAGSMRSAAARRQRHERAARRSKVAATPSDPEIAAIVHDELGRLPSRFRTAVVLCDLEGLALADAAGVLGCPVGTLKSRLARGRDRLRGRLERRGLAAPVVCAGRVMVPASLLENTAGLVVSGGSVSVRFLAKGVSRMWMLSSWKPLGILTVVAVALPLGVLWRERASATEDPDRPRLEDSSRPRPPTRVRKPLPAYVVEPPDLISVVVRGARGDAPIIMGERLVRPDGTVSLGEYGSVYVAGMTVPEIKEKIILHLREYLDDETLGLVDPTNRAFPGTEKEPRQILPDHSTRVVVEVTAYNSKVYYVQGAVVAPGRLPVTGSETVLDAINIAGGLAPDASLADIRLVRPAPTGAAGPQVLPVDYRAIVERGETATNHPIMPGDRLIVRRMPEADEPPPRPERAEMQAIERRLTEVERKLDRILQALGQPQPEPR